MERFDLVVIGDGAAGDSVLRPAAQAGKRVALFEHDRLGGECLNYGCVPSKTLYRSAEVFQLMHRAGEFGVRADGLELYFPAVLARARHVIDTISGADPWGGLRADGITAFRTSARFLGPHELEADGEPISADQIVIASGTKAGLPPIPGLAEVDPLTNESIFAISSLPPRLAVIGAGPIGAEMAQIFARFGAAVTLLEMLPRSCRPRMRKPPTPSSASSATKASASSRTCASSGSPATTTAHAASSTAGRARPSASTSTRCWSPPAASPRPPP